MLIQLNISKYCMCLILFILQSILFMSCFSSSQADKPKNDLQKTECSPDMVLIAGGTFISGKDGYDKDNSPLQRQINTFCLDKYEVTVKQFKDVMGILPDLKYKRWRWKDNDPIVLVNYEEAKTYCNKLGKRLPKGYEWEYAAGGSNHYIWSLGNEFDPKSYWCSVSPNTKCKYPHSIGSFKANDYGLYDMTGNVWEWVDGEQNVRGGGWDTGSSDSLRISNSGKRDPIDSYFNVGFRCAK